MFRLLPNTTYYVRDVAGQVMAVYNDVGGDPALEEQPVYGAGRIGIAYSGNNKEKTYVYELTDHLGNVRAVFTKAENDANLEGYTDYYPGGMPMPNRTLLGPEGYRYAFQGQEKDPETGKEAFQLRLWDGRIGRWLTTDPMGEFASPYLGMGNNPILSIDPTGGMTDGCCDDDWVSNGLNELDGVTMMGMDKSGDMMRGLAGLDFSINAPLFGTGFNTIDITNLPMDYTYGDPIFNYETRSLNSRERMTALFSGSTKMLGAGGESILAPLRLIDKESYGTNYWDQPALPLPASSASSAQGIVANSINPIKNINRLSKRFPFKTTEHFIIRVYGRATRGITPTLAISAYNNGRLFYNPETRNFIRHLSSHKISVVVSKPSGGRAISVFEGNPSPTWNVVKFRR